ncbi:MAG: HAMP domain-containing protein [Anaerolineae bacterium]|nr:HAMP domain-containing protein [Anaerolineae bacterium]
MSVRLKIVLSYLILILIFIGLGTYIIYSERYIAAQMALLDKQFDQTALGGTELDKAEDLVKDLLTTRLTLHELLLDEPGASQDFQKSGEHFDTHYDELVAVYERYVASASEGTDARLTEIEANRLQLEAIAQGQIHFQEDTADVVNLINEGKRDQAKAMLDEDVEPELIGLNEQVFDFEETVEQQMEQANEAFDEAIHAVEQRVAWLRLITMTLIGVSIFIAVGLSAWIGKLITDPVNALSLTAESIEQGAYELKRLPPLVERQDEFGILARVFQRMASEIHTREQNLKQQIQQLYIKIDRKKKEEQVAEITETDFFQSLEAKASQFRKRASRSNSNS